MQRHTDGQVTWLTFDLFTEFPSLIHGVFLRFSSEQGDLKENVTQNWQRALSALQIKTWTSLFQHHGKSVIQAHPSYKEKGDALTTDLSQLGLVVLHADCQAAIFYDPIHHALALVHCGWRGSVQNIYQETLKTMNKLYGSKAEDVLVGISPSLGPAASEFLNYQKELPTSFYPFQTQATYFDFWAISKWQLTECGVLPHHIEIAQLCTYFHPEDFFSYRRLKISGRHATIASLI
jgi:YfiH family protein